jgi:hypothetical protein
MIRTDRTDSALLRLEQDERPIIVLLLRLTHRRDVTDAVIDPISLSGSGLSLLGIPSTVCLSFARIPSALVHSPARSSISRRSLRIAPCESMCVRGNANPDCVRTVSDALRNPDRIPSLTGTRRCTSMLREVVDRERVGASRCASARGAGIYFQACSFNHSDISPFRINHLQRHQREGITNCVRPPNVPQSLTGVSSIAAVACSERSTPRGRAPRQAHEHRHPLG